MGRNFIKTIFLGILLSFITSYSYAIEVVAPQAPTSTLPPLAKEAIEPEHDVSYGNTPIMTTASATPVAVPVQASGEQIYYVRSMTSNNPEYKTRFSILHETPSPKRIAGERLYNLSDENFRLAVHGNQIRVLDNPVFKLTGINSAKGRTGELRLNDNGRLNIETISSRFRGSWDIDGTGELNQRVTPTNLISGDLPATLITRNIDGSVRTHEDYIITFKAMAMGPYNGYWSNGSHTSIWLWGMSRTKTRSGEFTYVGLDLGITSVALPADVTGSVAPAEQAAAPIVTGAVPTAVAGGTYIPEPATGGIQTGPYGGGFGGGFGGGGYYGGGGGGGGTVTIIEKPYCVEHPNDKYCVDLDCTKMPNDPRCYPPLDCTKNPNHPDCRLDCTKTPNDPACVINCKINPNHPDCRLDCTKTPNDPRCVVDCKTYPTHPVCVCDCTKTPDDPRCHPDCKTNPNDPRCPMNCEDNPDNPSCPPKCPNPKDPRCDVNCDTDPTNPLCQEVDCSKNPSDPRCTPTCPDPNNPRCGTEVSEPWWISLTLLAGLGYILRRRRNSNS